MSKHILRIASLLIAAVLLISTFAVGSFALEWDGDSVEGGGGGTDAGKVGYALRTTGDNVIGYRFSLVDENGNNVVSKVIDIFRDKHYGRNGYSYLHKFVPKYNKCQLIDNQDGAFSTAVNSTNCYKEADLTFATELPEPKDMGTWQNNVTNLNVVLDKLGAGSVEDLSKGDMLIVEPIYDVRLESVWHAVTTTEIAVYGKATFGGDSTGGNSTDSEKFGFISGYTNKHYPNALFTPDGQGLWNPATATSKRLTFKTVIDYGYGVGIAYTQETGAEEPNLIVNLCEAWLAYFGDYTDMYGYSIGPSFDDWVIDYDYPIMGDDIWFDVHFPRETENYYVRQTVTVDDEDPVSREIWSNRGVWFNAKPDDMTIDAGKEYYTVVARVDWIDENGNVLKYGTEKTFYIPVQPKVNRYQIIAYNSTGRVQAYDGMSGSSGAVYYGQRIYVKYQYTCDTTWTSYNNLYGTMYEWVDGDWEPILGAPDGTDIYEAMVKGTTDTVSSNCGYVHITDNYDSGDDEIPFYLVTAWSEDPEYTSLSTWYSIPILTPDVELSEVYLVNASGTRLDHTDLTVGETVYIRYKYKNNTNCTLIVDGYNNDRERISSNGVYRIPANGTITVAGGSMVVSESSFSIWGGVYLEGAGIYNTEYESDGTNNELTLDCNASYPLTLTPIAPNASYREGTTVITSFWLNNGGGTDVTPGNNITIRMRVFKPNGTLITTQTITQAIVPGNNRNLYYFKWTVPTGLNGQRVRVVADIVDGNESFSLSNRYYATCVYPQFDTPDTNYEDKAPDGFSVPSAPTATTRYATWWQWQWENGDFVKKYYGIGIPKTSSESLTPDPNSNSTYKNGYWTMKSGYGVWLRAVNSVCGVSGYAIPSSSAYTVPQFAYAAYPEFGYGYGANVCTTLRLQSGYWYFSSPNSPKYHYTPIYFPDGQYVVKIVKSDMWTPAGMISAVSTTKPITIKDSAYDDWFVGRE